MRHAFFCSREVGLAQEETQLGFSFWFSLTRAFYVFAFLQLDARLEENEYAYVDEFPFVPRPLVENTRNHRKDFCAGVAQDCGYNSSTSGSTSRDPLYVHNNPASVANHNSHGLLHDRAHSLGGAPIGESLGDPPKYFTLDPEMAPNTKNKMAANMASCLPANIPVKLSGNSRHGNNNDVVTLDNRYEIQDPFPRKMLTFKADASV